MKEFWCDTETTGTDPDKHGIWQLSYEFHGGDKPPLTRSFNMQPHKGDLISGEALKVGDITRDDLLKFPPPQEVYSQLIKDLTEWPIDKFNKKDKALFCGYNARFDNDFLRAWFKKFRDDYFGSWFWFPPIDVMGLAAYHLRESRPMMEDFKLHTVCKWLEVPIEENKLHDSAYDIALTIECYEVILDYHRALFTEAGIVPNATLAHREKERQVDQNGSGKTQQVAGITS